MGPGFGARSGILTLTIKDKAVLYAAYMPYIRQGGLFIPTQKQYQLGDEVFLLLNLMDEGGDRGEATLNAPPHSMQGKEEEKES